MNLLIDKLPQALTIDGVEYPIDTDFRTAIRYEMLQEEADENLVEKGLRLFYGERIPLNIPAAIEQLNWFLACGKTDKKVPFSAKGNGRQAFSFSQDAEYVYAAFLDQYGVDLLDVEYMHWWKFRALFDSMRDNNRLMEIMGYRVARLENLPKEQRQFYQDMQRYYEIHSKRTDETLSKLEEILKNGGDPGEVLVR